jgi:hypothetical protein
MLDGERRRRIAEGSLRRANEAQRYAQSYGSAACYSLRQLVANAVIAASRVGSNIGL